MTYKITPDLKSLGKLEKAYAKTIKDEVMKAMKTAARQCIPVLSARTMDAPFASDSPHNPAKGGAYATGALLAGWEIAPSYADMSVSIYNDVRHAGWVEMGVRGSKKMLGAAAYPNIEKWIQAKNINFTYKGKQITTARMAIIIAKAINKRQGWRFKPRRIANRARPRVLEIFKARMREAVQRSMAKAVKSVAVRAATRGLSK